MMVLVSLDPRNIFTMALGIRVCKHPVWIRKNSAFQLVDFS
jgi:hypothetical protein